MWMFRDVNIWEGFELFNYSILLHKYLATISR